MEKVYLSTIRDIWFNKSRSLVVILALIMVVAFPISFLNVAPNLNTIIEDEQETYHLAHFNIFFDTYYDTQIVDKVDQYLADYLQVNINDVYVEGRRFEGSKIQATGGGNIPADSWIDVDVIGFTSGKAPYVSAMKVVDGRLPETKTEVAILDSLARSDNLQVGDQVTFYDSIGPVTYSISGLIKTTEYSAYELSQSGMAYMNIEGFERLNNRPDLSSLTNQISVYFDFDISTETLKNVSSYIKVKIADEGVNIVLFWFVRETSFRKALLDALNLTSQYMVAASIFIFLVAGVVIFVVTNRYITEQKRRIGALYSFGVRRREIMYSFFLRIFILSIIAVILGLIVSKLMLGIIVKELVSQWGLIGFENQINMQSIGFTLVSAAIVSYLFTFLAVTNLVRLTPYEAMRGKSSELKSRGLLFKLSSLLPSRLLRGAAKNLTRNRTRSFLTVVAFTIALTFSGSLIYTDQSIGHTIDTFYDNRISFDVEVNLGSPLQIQDSYLVNQITSSPAVEKSEYFLNNLIQLTDRPDVLTYLLAYQYNTSMYDLSDNNILEGRWYDRNSSEIVISRYLEGTLGITIGEELVFDYLGARFNVTVVGVTNDILFNSALLGDFDYFNNILAPIYNQISPSNYIIANKILLQLKDGYSIESFQNQLNLENTGIDIALTKNSYERRSTALSNSQTAIIYLMVTLGLVVGMVSVFTTLLIAVVERERELALLQVFGYKKHELLVQIILEGWIIGVISLIPTFFLARLVSTHLWVNIVSDNLYKVYAFFPFTTNITLSIFAISAITISILPAFRSAVSKKIAETIREE